MEQRFEALLAELNLPRGRSFTLEEFLRRASAKRARPIKLVAVPVDDPDGPSGAWVPYPRVDVIFHKVTTRPHRAHIVLHESSHMLCRHPLRRLALPSFLAQYSPDGHDPQTLLEAFGLLRSGWSDDEESEAEDFARYVGPRIRHTDRATTQDASDAFARILNALGGGQRGCSE